MRLEDKIKIQHTPVWAEVKTWDSTDKWALITLLYATIDEDEHTAGTDYIADGKSKELLLQAGEYALTESRAGRGIPHAQAMRKIRKRMGWE